jgi:hypothetical protein
MLDSPVVSGWRAHGLHALKMSGLIGRVSPGKVSQSRRHEWPSKRAVAEHWGAKSLFRRWHPEVLADYVAAGTERRGGKTVLAFDRDVETRLYNTLPHHFGTLLRRRPPRCLVGFVAGTRSIEIRQAGLAATRALVGPRLRWIDGTHLFPMQLPDETAETVLDLLGRMIALDVEST